MIELNVEFQEEYKKLDSLCKDLFSSYDGVSEYIRQMEATPFRDQQLVYSWDSEYKQLKHMRWLRNQLAHEIGTLDSDLCDDTDIDWIKSFYNKILEINDPLALVAKVKKEEVATQSSFNAQNKTIKSEPKDDNKQHISLWKKFILKIKSIFGSKS